MSNTKSREIDFAELSDGSLVEMIRDPANTDKTLLAIYCDGSVRYAESVEDGDKITLPLSDADQVLKYVRLAQGAEPYGSLLGLRKSIARFFCQCLDIADEWCILLTGFAMSTWFAEKSAVAPYVAFVGPPGSGKTTTMRVLSLVCYRSLMTSNISSAAFYDVSDRIHPTVLLDETLTAGNPRDLMHLLRASSTAGFVSLKKDQARMAYGPKVFSWLELPNDAALNSRCVIVPMYRTSRTDLKSPNDPRVLECAEKLMRQLQQFRFEHYKKLESPKIPPDIPLSGRSLDLYRALAFPFDEDPDMCRVLGRLIADQDEFQVPVLSASQSAVLRALYTFIHERPEVPGISVRSVTASVNEDLAGRGEFTLNERKMGEILTSLSFTGRSRTNTGFVLWLDRSARERIHSGIRHYGSENPVEQCEFCAKAGVSGVKTVPAEALAKEPAQLPVKKSERSEHRERRSRNGKRSHATEPKGLCVSRPKASRTD